MIDAIDWIAQWALYSPEKVAVSEIETGRSYTYGQLNHIADHLANELINEHRLEKGDRIVVLAEHCLEYVVLFSVAQKTGLILVPLNYRLAPAEIDYLIVNAEPKLTIVEDKFADRVSGIAAMEKVTLSWTLEDLVAKCGQTLHKGKVESKHAPDIADDDPFFILYTSGTTGFPKGAVYTHKMLLWNSFNTTIGLNITSEDITVLCMPPFHTGGWNVLLTPIIHRGGRVSIFKKFDAIEVLKALEEEQANIFMAVPTMLKMMTESTSFDSTNLEAMRYFIVGGEALPLPVIETWHNKGVKLRQGYGLTEVGPNLTSLHHDDAIRKIGSIGRPNFFVTSKIIDENGEQVKQGEIGEFCFKGDIVTPGYWRNTEATEKAFINGWFRTGDLVKADEEAFLYVMDRKKNMFISGGENVYPAEVERVICQHSQVSEVAVVGVSDVKWGEVGKAYVVPSEDIDQEVLLNFCREQMAKFKVPKYFEFVSELPKTDSGKIDRKVLAQLGDDQKKRVPN
ncbi:MAG: long-chain fatty acid--CoA ligase [Bacteroidota bacterium]